MPLDRETINAMYPGFEVKCLKCQSTNVILENDIAFSEASGQWGHVTLICQDCGNATDIVG